MIVSPTPCPPLRGEPAREGDKERLRRDFHANVPVNNFWAVTLYDTQTRSQLQTSNPYPTLGSQTKGVKKNADGSYDIYFGPKPPQGKESNWLETVSGKAWFPILRMYGPLKPWINKTWRPSEIELVE